MKIMGSKNNKDIYDNLLSGLIPDDIEVYIEPFGGLFGLYQIMSKKPPISVYNDINIELYNDVFNKYDNTLYHNIDYKDIIEIYDNEKAFFYVDPPYLKNEHYYKNHNFRKEEDHGDLAHILKNIKGRFLLSYQDRELMRKLYHGYNFYKYTGNDMFRIPEIAITNY